MTHFVSIDLETRSCADLRATGVYTYAEHPTTDVWCAAYALDDGPVQVWHLGRPMPDDLKSWAIDPRIYFRAWNASFERILWRDVLALRHGWPAIADSRWVCTMVMGAAAGLPRSLEEAAIALGMQEQKDMAGSRLMMQMTKPRSVAADGTITWWTDAAKRRRLAQYCAQDVVVERAIWDQLPAAMNRSERQLYLLDQQINDRGVALDLDLIQAAEDLADAEQATLNQELAVVTRGAVASATKVADLKTWVALEAGTPVESLDKSALDTLLAGDLPEHVRRALEIRREAAKTSVRKLTAMKAVAGADGRARGLLAFYGAGTGRWAGRLIQPQNFPRGAVVVTEEVIQAIHAGRELVLPHGAPLEVISSALRGCLVASPGTALYVADFASIEARVVAWLAGQASLLNLFASGGKVYETMAATIFGVPLEEVTKDQRQVGKAAILGCGFQMGPRRFAEAAGVPAELAERAVAAYRLANPRIKSLWWEMNAAALEVVTHGVTSPQAVIGTGGKITFRMEGRWLAMGLPSGRSLWYVDPRVVMREVPWSDAPAPAVRISTQNSFTRKWEPADMYGGIWTENATQAVARDLMAEGMTRLEANRFPVLLTVHDEVIAQADPRRSVGDFVSLLSEVPSWAAGCPIAAEGWSGPRYRK